MKHQSLFFLLLLHICWLPAQQNIKVQQNDYAPLWDEVAALEKKSLPQSATDAVNYILRMAIQDRNSPQVIKALIHQGKYDLMVDAQNDTLIFRNLHEMLEKSNDTVEQSVLHSMLAELYLQYYQKDRWNIDQRTNLGDFVPADMKEWTRNIFYDKVVEHLNASLTPEEELVKAKVEFYAAVVELGSDSRRFYPTMYDFLARRAIEIFSQIVSDEDLSHTLAGKDITLESLFRPAEEFVKLPFDPQPNEEGLRALETYRKHLLSLLGREMPQSVLLTELDKLDYLSQWQDVYALHALPLLETLRKKWEEDELSVEIIDKMAAIYQNRLWEIPDSDSLQRKEKTRELYNLLRNSIQRYPEYERIAILENRLLQLTQPEYSVSGNKTFPVKGEKRLQINYRNIQSLTAKLYKISSPVEVQLMQSGIKQAIDGKRTFLKNIPVHLPEVAPYLHGETVIEVDVERPGTYMLTFDSSPETSGNHLSDYYFAVSDLAVFARSSAKDKYDFFVVDRVSGEPVRQAKIHIYTLQGNRRNSTITLSHSMSVSEEGLAVYHKDKDIPGNELFYHAVVGEDQGSLLSRLPSAYYEYPDDQFSESDQVHIFTDRSLYRPGQTVFFKAVCTHVKGDDHSIVAGKTVELVLRDANHREISKQVLKTNEFGSVSGEFMLPQSTLAGDFSIESAGGEVHFRVEEYKRPSFAVTFQKIDKTYTFGEEIVLKGKVENFSGIKLGNAGVHWVITRQQPWWWHWGSVPEHFTVGNITTDEEGEFEIAFTPEKPDRQHSLKSVFSFVVDATVTDLNGETQTGTYTVTVGDVSMILQAEMPERLEKMSDDKIVITARNLDGAEIAARGTYHLYTLLENDSINQLLDKGNFMTGEQIELKRKLSALPSGKYRLKLQSEDDRGNPIAAEKDFILFSYADKHPPVRTNDWLIEKNSTFSKGKNAEVILGVSDKVHVLYELWQENTLLERKWITMHNENRLFSFPYKSSYENGVTLMLTYVKEEKFYAHSVDLRPENEKEELHVTLAVFRDKIRPGAEEEWRISVTDAAGNPALAEVLASMYDFSLDQIYPSHPWDLSFSSSGRYFSAMGLTGDQSFYRQTAAGYLPTPFKTVEPFDFDRFNWFGLPLFYAGRIMLRGAVTGTVKTQASLLRAKSADEASMVQDLLAEEEIGIAARYATSPPPPPPPAPLAPASGENGQENDALQIRRNFNETAFFYPQLKTNEKGELQIAFTVPESNTRWRFRVLAHDQELNTGKTEAFTVSQKELMVTPNMPRFLRHGDRTGITTKVSNLSDSMQQGKVSLELFNPVTDELINDIPVANPVQDFSLAPDASADVSWTFDVPAGIDLLGVRIIAQSAAFSDGEQHALAVLPNRMLVTESMRLDVNGNQTKTFTMDHLLQHRSQTLQDYRLTLEFTSNPVWYAVQALPVLGQPQSDNAVSWFASYYANTLGAHIGKAYPKVSAMVEAWKKQGGSRETFLSNLEKNRELKSVLLEETPWVLEANTESEQKEKLSLLFDLNRSRDLTRAALGKLQELQTNQGGWSWFKGFHPNVSITQYILYGFHQLKELGVAEISDEAASMLSPAISFIDEEAIRRYEEMKRLNKAWKELKIIPVTDLEYLYVRTAYAEYPMDEDTKEPVDFYRSVIEKNWTDYNLYERSLIAILMQRAGKTQVVQQILQSYREHAVVSDEMGMYWPNNRAQVFMSQSAISVHTFIMDAFRSGGSTTGEMDQMKRWLLKQKQTQVWETTHATADAVYALLSTGDDWFSTGGETGIMLGDQHVEPDQREAGSGYFKKTWDQAEMVPEMGKVTVTHRGNAPAWGALYWQYYEDMDKIGKTDAALDIEKQLFVEKTDASGTGLMRITEDNPLTVGDKVVVRLTLRTDRDLEFVHLKDMRAASLEPVNQISGMGWQNGIRYCQTTKDASTHFYFDILPRGTYVLEYAVYVNRAGSYANGISTVQCMYAPEFTSHTAGIRIIVK